MNKERTRIPLDKDNLEFWASDENRTPLERDLAVALLAAQERVVELEAKLESLEEERLGDDI